MKENLLQPRVYTDTMRGGEFKLEMREKLGVVGSFDADMRDLDLEGNMNPTIKSELELMWQQFIPTC
ncbi:hypothetical protein SAMN04487833_1355 [Sarcina sp. DSM 11001]|uniref:hypothetical protein n=1 Tax=Sarcina sp. DSM 11001 TaxID=1798184 RepID=UPI00088A2C2E|nr:hypothetical protein [Sarcina sp. DSM 11001]SDL85547.1 hypothetical protein SAMN04487833_1355 [Sarcina sp. DSM 11001]